MKKAQELKQTLILAAPIIISQVGQLAYGLMDSAMVGKLGAVQLSASAFVNNVFNIPFIFLAGVTSATSVLISQQFGAKNYKSIGDILWSCLWSTFILAIITILGLFFLGNHLEIFNQPQEVLEASRGYYSMIIWSILPFILFFIFKHFSEAVSQPAIPTLILIIGLIVNYFLNRGLIYGDFGLPAYGLYGAGIATLIARWLCVFIFLALILKSKKYKLFFKTQFEFKYFQDPILKFFKLGIPSGLQYLFEVMAFAGAGIMMGWIGTIALASHQIAIQIASFTFMFALGLSFATAVRIGQLYGQQNYLGLRNAGISSFYFIGILLALMGTVILLLRHWIPTVFINDPEVIKIASQLFIIVFFFQIFDGTQAVGISALRALNDVKIPTLIALSSYWGVAIPMGYYLGFHTSLSYLGIWMSLGFGLAVASILVIARFHFLTKKLMLKSLENI